ncbi:YaaC family protein [Bacillus sp. RAR_GA_16]|uniref:YaaC family protein n=1 Tax=Bacillus sp. RAR_GA_16 TaxID=2876774 RepID=UPI001CCF8EFF|nr:YaaC family protein [Bacillus sp. RAR_GA_16]MCA0170761.1 YaaC family protein [Bacillus sp. RAR_GA_16]
MGYSGHHQSDSFAYHSASYVQQYLKECYSKIELPDAERKSYDTCYRFMYFIEYGDRYYRHAETANTELKPILLFYGMIQLLKACLVTIDPNYPGDTHVLAHGVTSRKRKKRHYSFLQDEVKGQKNGLFEYFSRKMFHVKQVEGEKYKMEDLLSLIPEMSPLFMKLNQKATTFSLISLTPNSFTVSSSILDSLNMTVERFESYLQHQGISSVEILTHSRDLITLQVLEEPVREIQERPFLYDKNGIYLPAERGQYNPITEVMVHYLILYNLSMICRYETEWWGDLFHTQESVDLPFILQFLEVTSEKIPKLLYAFLDKRGQ